MNIDPEQPAFLRVPVKCIPAIIEALNRAEFFREAAAVKSFTEHYTDPVLNQARLRWLENAKAVAKEGEIEFDSDATISNSQDGGEYVLGWIWINDPQAGYQNEFGN